MLKYVKDVLVFKGAFEYSIIWFFNLKFNKHELKYKKFIFEKLKEFWSYV